MNDTQLASRIAESDGRVFVGFKNKSDAGGVDDFGNVLATNASVRAGRELLDSLGVSVESDVDGMPYVTARMSPDRLAALRHNPLIDYVEPIRPGKYLDQTTTWNVERILAPSVWSSTTGAGTILQIIDSGIHDHPDLTPSFVNACDGSNGDDDLGHGTAVAGIIAAQNNSEQIVGAAYDVSIWSTKVTGVDGNGEPDPSQFACAVHFGRTNGAKVINMSLGFDPYAPLTDEIAAAYFQNDVVIVAAAGNEQGGAVTYPATLATVIAVGAVDTNNVVASFSSTGPELELVAPGATVTDSRGLTSTCLNGTSCTHILGAVNQLIQGTSFAAPHVAAAAAMLRSYNYAWPNWEIRRRIWQSAADLGPAGRDDQYGYGLLNIAAAIAANPPFTATITGVSEIGPYVSCDWYVSTSGGTPPYAYSWSVDGYPVGDDSDVLNYENSGNSFYLTVHVQDASGNTANGALSVDVMSGAYCN